MRKKIYSHLIGGGLITQSIISHCTSMCGPFIAKHCGERGSEIVHMPDFFHCFWIQTSPLSIDIKLDFYLLVPRHSHSANLSGEVEMAIYLPGLKKFGGKNILKFYFVEPVMEGCMAGCFLSLYLNLFNSRLRGGMQMRG